jgi:hypothetical protein
MADSRHAVNFDSSTYVIQISECRLKIAAMQPSVRKGYASEAQPLKFSELRKGIAFPHGRRHSRGS